MAALNAKTELVLAAYLTGLNLPNVISDESSQDKTPPEIVCGAKTANEEPPFSGNYWVDFEIETISMFTTPDDESDPKVAHDALAESVFNALADTTLPAKLTAAAAVAGLPWTCMGMEELRQESLPMADSWHTSVMGRLYCCGSALAA